MIFLKNNSFPDNDKWTDRNVFINSNFAIDPISYGVATFDGLDSTGFPYDFSIPDSYGEADVLTSQSFDLINVIDSVFLSFYYQPQGNGNQPETQDSLRLEFFKNSDSTWVRVWGVRGSSSHPFKRVMIHVDSSFQSNAFQFRFKNYATLSGNVDHWNVDYVYLNDNRSINDTVLHDVSFITDHYNLLAEFTAMPWDHYQTDTIGLMAQELPVVYKNNSNSITYPVFYKYEVTNDNGTGPIVELYPPTADFKNVNPLSTLVEPQAVYNLPINDFTFPTDNDENKVFRIRNYFNLGSGVTDSLIQNDTVVSYQVFGSYYAYDDGSAEVGYGIQGLGSKLAHEFNIRKEDTLTALQIYFSPIQDDLSQRSFTLTIWSSLNPENIIYQQSSTYSPTYSSINEFLNYPLDDPIILTPGTYYVGWEKESVDFLNVGWDLNTNNRNKVHFNATGVWQTSSFDGTLMLRPVFGTTGDPLVSINENNSPLKDDFKIYPNPASNFIYFDKIGSSTNNRYDIQLINIYGKVVISRNVAGKKVNVSHLNNGVYFLQFINNENTHVITKKILIAR